MVAQGKLRRSLAKFYRLWDSSLMSENMSQVKVNTSDVEWIKRNATDPVAYGTDIKGALYFQATISVAAVERTTFAGADMIRFDLGADAPRDHSRWAMYPATYLVA